MAKPDVLILHASGTNRDHEAAKAVSLAGGTPHIVHLQQLATAERKLDNFQMMVVAGGFSYGDAIAAGKRLALDMQDLLHAPLQAFVAAGKPLLGICNGFQALLKAGLLDSAQSTLSHNHSQRFECRWVTLQPNPASPCVFTRNLSHPIYCPAAHGEGRFMSLSSIEDARIALRYSAAEHDAIGEPSGAGQPYPNNPNGSQGDIAGICNAQGNVLGLMPHPEDNVLWYQHPQWTRHHAADWHELWQRSSGLALFEAGIRYAAEFC